MESHPTFNFIKLIVSHHTQSTGIRIPSKFTEKHGNELLDRVILKLPNADVWQLHLTKLPDDIWLKNGWSEFADRYGLRFGYLLMFRYQGSSIFCVTIFSANGSEILYPPPPTKTDPSTIPTKQVKLEDEDQKPNLDISNDGGECSRKQKRGGDGRKALERAKLNFKSHKPFFMVYMNQNFVTRRSGPTVPGAFRKKHWRDSENHTKYVLQLAQKHGTPKTWEVAVHNAYFMVAGWMKFVKENGIAVGDICVFELIHKHQNVLAVTILRS